MKERLVICNEEDTDGRAMVHRILLTKEVDLNTRDRRRCTAYLVSK